MNFYSFHIGDYSTHTAHLDPIEDVTYRRMLDLYYLRESPLPSDVSEVARLIRMKDYKECVQAVLNEFFTLTDNGWVNGRCNADIAKMQDKQAKAKASAAISVAARSTNAQRTLSERSTNDELPIPIPIPIPKPIPKPVKTKDINTLAQSEDSFDWFWSAYPKKKSKGQAEKIWSKLNPDSELVQKILSALDTAKRSNDWMKDGGQFIPYPSTWLNAKGWEDEIYQQTTPIISNYQNVAVFERFLNSGERE